MSLRRATSNNTDQIITTGRYDPRLVSELNGKGYYVSTAQGFLDVLNQFRTMASCGRIYIHLAAGTYNFTSGIQFRNWNTGNATGIFIEGSGVDSTILNFTGIADYTGCIDMQDSGVLHFFKGFTVNQTVTKSHQEGIRCQTSRCIIETVKVTNCDEGITAGTGGHVTLYGNITTNNCNIGLYSVADMYHGYGTVHTANTCNYGMSAASGGRIAMMSTNRMYTDVPNLCTPSLGASTGNGWIAGYWYA